MSKALIVGDVHGRPKRLKALLIQAGIISPEGERIDHETKVIQLGDLIDANPYRTPVWLDHQIVTSADQWVDEFLWGNHERPIINGPVFGGYARPEKMTLEMLAKWRQEGRYKLATHFDDHLITHAGLSDLAFTGARTGSLKRYSPERLARWLNIQDAKHPHPKMLGHQDYGDPSNTWGMRDNIGHDRGGWDPFGGVLWRDSREGLWPVPQIFGHTSHQVAVEIEHSAELFGSEVTLKSYCIDTSKHDRVSGIWLPSLEVVTVDDTEDFLAG
jgi:hypothetical protein